MNKPAAAAPAGDYKDRRAGLIGFGILLVAAGCVCALFVPLMVVGQAMAAQTTGTALDIRMIIPSVMMYAGLAVAFVWVGIGSIRTRRWARALALILAWLWLVTGIFTLGFMAVLLPDLLSDLPSGGQPLPVAMRSAVMIVLLAIMGAVLVVLPGLLVLFYRSRHVKATCEARDPLPGWTEACPLPVLGLSLSLGFGAVSMLPSLVTYHSVVPWFGRLLSGAPGAVVILFMMALWSYCAWATYRLQPAGWWLSVVSSALMMLSAVVTLLRVDPIEMYRLMGFPEQQIDQMRQVGFLVQGRGLAVLTALFSLAFLGYLLSVKRHFHAPGE
jgi:MFS family permease